MRGKPKCWQQQREAWEMLVDVFDSYHKVACAIADVFLSLYRDKSISVHTKS